MTLDAQAAWALARAFGDAIEDRLGHRLVAAYVVGSLAEDAYRPGTSGIDVAVVFAGDRVDDATEIEVRRAKSDVAGGDPTRIRRVLLTTNDLGPPYPPDREVIPEVLRIQDEGVLVTGQDVRHRITRPSPRDVHAHIRYFDRMVRLSFFNGDADELPPPRELFTLAATACRHYIFDRENLWIWPKRDSLMAFRIGYEDHSSAPFVEELLRVENDGGVHDGSIGPGVSRLWRRLHKEIVS